MSRNTSDESLLFEFQHHLVDRGWCHPEVSFHVRFSWCPTIDLRIVINECKVLALFFCESHFVLIAHLLAQRACGKSQFFEKYSFCWLEDKELSFVLAETFAFLDAIFLSQNRRIICRRSRFVVSVPGVKHGEVYLVVNEVMKAMFKGPRKDLPIKVYRYELPLGIIILFVSRHISPFFTKRSLRVPRSSRWRYYHAFRTFSTGSTIRPKNIIYMCPVESVLARFCMFEINRADTLILSC